MIRSIRAALVGLAVAASLAFGASLGLVPAQAQVYPYQTPTYVPTAIAAAATLTATGDYDFASQSRSGAAITVKALTGTLVATVQGSSDPLTVADASATWSTLYYMPCAGGALANSISANGVYCLNPGGFTRFRVHVTTLSGGGATVTIYASATAGASWEYSASPSNLGGTGGDPCQNASILKSSAVINIGVTATTKIVDTVAGKTVYVCGFFGSLAGTTPSITFKTGTRVSADCDTSAASLSGVILPTSGSMVGNSGQGTIMTSISGGQICGTTAGTGSSYQGTMFYVQQ